MTYGPPPEVIERYAKLLIDYALGGGGGIKAGDVVRVIANEDARPMYVELCKAVWRSGGHVIQDYGVADDTETGLDRAFIELASDEQLDFLPEKYMRGVFDEIDHYVVVVGDRDPHASDGVDPERKMRHARASGPVFAMVMEGIASGTLTWTGALYGTPAMAAEARLSLEEYWGQIIKACFLDDEDPIARWREVNDQIEAQAKWLSSLPIERLHVLGEDVDLHITLGEQRKWVAGGGANIPSFEVFTSPDWRGTEGWIRFNQPLYYHGPLIEGIELKFERGEVVSATAMTNEELLKQMVAGEGAGKVGEFSLTDSRISRVDHFMANTLYDENTGGRFGNTHIALGFALPSVCFAGDPATLSDEESQRLGFNVAASHTDIVSTTDRTVTATLSDGSELVIYEDGKFTQ
jgi:aminopeptidase